MYLAWEVVGLLAGTAAGIKASAVAFLLSETSSASLIVALGFEAL
jgi:hypothetical protein